MCVRRTQSLFWGDPDPPIYIVDSCLSRPPLLPSREKGPYRGDMRGQKYTARLELWLLHVSTGSGATCVRVSVCARVGVEIHTNVGKGVVDVYMWRLGG